MNETLDILEESELEQELENNLIPDIINPDTIIEDSDPLEVVNSKMVREGLIQVLKELTARERAVLEYRFGLKDNYAKTLNEVGQLFSVSGMRIRQIESKAFRKLRRPDRFRKIELLLYGENSNHSLTSNTIYANLLKQ